MDATQRRARDRNQKEEKGVSPTLPHRRQQLVAATSGILERMWPTQAREQTPEMDRIDRPRINRSEHEKRIHKLSHQDQQDLIATPWDIWERKGTWRIYRTGSECTTKKRKTQQNKAKTIFG
jgi:hypothetical protein